MRTSISPLTAQLVLWLTLSIATVGQGPISDQLVVTLPNTTWVGSQPLPPGTYTVRQLPTASNPRLLEFSSDDGTKLEAAVTTIAAIDNNNTRDTSVIVQQQGGQYHLTHVWVAGKTYGYELPVDDSKLLAKTSEKVTLAATYIPAPQEVAAAPAPPEPAPAPAAPQPAPEPAPVAQAPAQPPAAPTPPPAEIPEPAPQPTETAQVAAQTPPMPETAGYWAELLLAGSILITLGMFLAPRRLWNS